MDKKENENKLNEKELNENELDKVTGGNLFETMKCSECENEIPRGYVTLCADCWRKLHGK